MSSLADMLGAAVTAVTDLRDKAALGVVGDICVKLKANPGKWLPAVKACAKEQPFWPAVVPLFKSPALTIPAQPEFSAKEFAKPGFWLGDEAKTALGVWEGKVWEPTEAVVVRPQELDRPAIDQEIWDSVGGVEVLEYSPGQQHYAMQNLLVKDSRWYVCYLTGADNNHWAVYFRWYADGRHWYLGAYRAPGPHTWVAGRRFLVCDS